MTKHNIPTEQFINVAHIDMSKPVGVQLKALRLKMGVSASTISRITGKPNNHIYKLEVGKIKDPQITSLMEYLNAAGYGSVAITNSELEPYSDKRTRKAVSRLNTSAIKGDYAEFTYRKAEHKVRLDRVHLVLPDNFAQALALEANTYRLSYTPINGITLNKKGIKERSWLQVPMKESVYLQIVTKSWMKWMVKNTPERIPWAKNKQKVKQKLQDNLEMHKKEFNL